MSDIPGENLSGVNPDLPSDRLAAKKTGALMGAG
jgi:hypothetical protein